MLVSISDNARQCELIRIIKELMYTWICVGICTDKVSNSTCVYRPTFYINANLTDGPPWTLQTDMVVAKAEESMVGPTEYY